jgi:transcription termination factor Rho
MTDSNENSSEAPEGPTPEPPLPAEGNEAGDASQVGSDRPKRRRRGHRASKSARSGAAPAGSETQAEATNRELKEMPADVAVSGILDLAGNSKSGNGAPDAGRLRQLADGLVEGPNDPIVPAEVIQRFQLRQNSRIEALARPSLAAGNQTGPARLSVHSVRTIEGLTSEVFNARRAFAELTPLDPAPRMTLEYGKSGPTGVCPPACRLIDLFCPIGFGTRGLIVAPPKAGKTVLLQNIAFGIKHNHPQVELIALLIDERPEEVTDFKRNVPAHVLASSNDQDLDRHLSLGILAIERAKRMVEAGKDVVVLLDSLTRLGRAFNNSRKYGSSGRTMSGGLDSRALEVPKQLFGAARRAEEGGSLTIIATCLVDTGSRADQIIFEEFKGTGNMELILDREVAEKRIFPAINLAASGTRKEHLLLSEQALKTITALRRRLLSVPPHVQIEQLLGALGRFETNERLVAG